MTAAFPDRTTITTAAASKDMTVKATVKTEMGITGTADDDFIDTLIHQASAQLAGAASREFASERLVDRYRIWSYAACMRLYLSRWPVTTVHAIVEDGTTLDVANYEVDTANGWVLRLDGSGNPMAWAACALITIDHTSGYVMLTNLPHDLERACIDQVKAEYKRRKRDPTLRGETVPDVYQVQFNVGGGDGFARSGLLVEVEGALAPYRRWAA